MSQPSLVRVPRPPRNAPGSKRTNGHTCITPTKTIPSCCRHPSPTHRSSTGRFVRGSHQPNTTMAALNAITTTTVDFATKLAASLQLATIKYWATPRRKPHVTFYRRVSTSSSPNKVTTLRTQPAPVLRASLRQATTPKEPRQKVSTPKTFVDTWAHDHMSPCHMYSRKLW